MRVLEVMDDERNEDVSETRRENTCTTLQGNTCRFHQFKNCVKNNQRWTMASENFKKDAGGKNNLIREHEKMKISKVLSSGKETSQKNIMTLDVEKVSFYATGLSNGIEEKKNKVERW